MSDITVWLREICPDVRGDQAADMIEDLTARLEAAEKERDDYREDMFSVGALAAELLTKTEQQAAQIEALTKYAERWKYVLNHGFWCADNPNVEAYSKGGLMLTLHIHPINKEGFIAAIDAAREVKS